MNSIAKIIAASLLTTGACVLASPLTLPPETPVAAVGISAHDGITLSGTDVLITRNGVTERLTKDLTFDNGVKIQPNGSLLGMDGSMSLLRPDQTLSLDGTLSDTPPGASLAPKPAK